MIGAIVHETSLGASIDAMTRGFAGGMEEKALPQRHRGTETGDINALLELFVAYLFFYCNSSLFRHHVHRVTLTSLMKSFSVPLCLCGKAFLFCNRAHTPPPRKIFRHAFALLLFAALPALAVEPVEQLKNPALEARAREISAGLRCLVCQNETIDESNAGLAHDIRMLLRERLTAGDTDEQAVKAIVDRYGEFVLLNPPMRPATYLLWFGPVAVLLSGLLGGSVWLHRRSATAETAVPLSPDERNRLDAILREADR
jgi:cytochrome c-type biogenesis protein CcmH